MKLYLTILFILTALALTAIAKADDEITCPTHYDRHTNTYVGSFDECLNDRPIEK